MKRFPELWVLQAGALLILGFASVPMVRAIEQGPSGEYDIVESSRPDGKGGYRGKVTIKEQGPSFAVDWKLKSGENYTGVGILNGDILGVGYGDGLSGLAVYQIRGRNSDRQMVVTGHTSAGRGIPINRAGIVGRSLSVR